MRWLGGFLILVGLAFCQGGLIILGFPLVVFGITLLRQPKPSSQV